MGTSYPPRSSRKPDLLSSLDLFSGRDLGLREMQKAPEPIVLALHMDRVAIVLPPADLVSVHSEDRPGDGGGHRRSDRGGEVEAGVRRALLSSDRMGSSAEVGGDPGLPGERRLEVLPDLLLNLLNPLLDLLLDLSADPLPSLRAGEDQAKRAEAEE